MCCRFKRWTQLRYKSFDREVYIKLVCSFNWGIIVKYIVIEVIGINWSDNLVKYIAWFEKLEKLVNFVLFVNFYANLRN